MRLKSYYKGESDKRHYIATCEAAYRRQVTDVVQKLLQQRQPRILTLCGPSCSGKTTTATKLTEQLTSLGHPVHTVSIDDYYLDREVLLARAASRGGKTDFESAEAIDLKLLEQTFAAIRSGGAVTVPRFDFRSGKRCGFRTFDPGDADIFLFEGIQAFYPEVTALFGDVPHCSVYISVGDRLEYEHRTIPGDEIRLYRRIVRDYNFRSATPVFTLDLWESVRENEIKRILPYSKYADFSISSLMGYEISMLKPFLFSLLADIPDSSVHYRFARRVLERYAYLPTIGKHYLPKDSLYVEFLG